MEGTLFTSVSAGINHSLALDQEGKLWGFGQNHDGQVGDGTTVNRNLPVQIKGDMTFSAIAADGYQSVAMDENGGLWAWGLNEDGRLGDGTTTPHHTPVQIPYGA
jgi:alpha-tubulin suppressor-like RCC1 family protein